VTHTVILVRPEGHHGDEPSGEGLSTIPYAQLQIAIIILALCVQLAWLARDFPRRMNVHAFGDQIRRLIDAKNVERAVKLCGAAPKAIASRLARIGLEARLAGTSATRAMEEAVPGLMREAISGTGLVSVIGMLGITEGLVLVFRGVQDGAERDFHVQVGIPLALLALATALNMSRAQSWRRELQSIMHATRD
jgi:hypothetical protein